ncbi:MAG: hypothetical protein WCR51_12400 [Planctomycetia bacterium]
MPTSRPPTRAALRLLAGAALVAHSGCMSALTTTSLRDVVLETVGSVAEATAGDVSGVARDADVSASVATDDTADDDAVISEPAKPLSLDEAVDRAVSRLNGVGELDAATQATLLSILENTNPQDWPAAIDAFTASLEVHRPPRPIAAPVPPPVVPVAATEPEPAESLVFPATLAFPSPQAEPEKIAFVEAARPVGPEPLLSFGPATPADEPVDAVAPAVVAQPLGAEDPLSIEERPSDASQTVPASPTPTLAVRNACFVTRVRAWGVVDRFPEAAFRPGQDVIAYFELDAPTARQSAAGHSTSIDTLFRLVTADGRQIGQWDFEPIDETCHAPRRDYFARYFLRIPETASPGPCRLEFVVTDLVAGTSTEAHLDLDVR